MLDIIMGGSSLLDRTGLLLVQAGIGISKQGIQVLGDLKGQTAPLEIDGTGSAAAPGFMDLHSR